MLVMPFPSAAIVYQQRLFFFNKKTDEGCRPRRSHSLTLSHSHMGVWYLASLSRSHALTLSRSHMGVWHSSNMLTTSLASHSLTLSLSHSLTPLTLLVFPILALYGLKISPLLFSLHILCWCAASTDYIYTIAR